MLSNWVTGGGNLIAMAPDAQLAGLLGLTARRHPLAEGYLLVDTTSAPGNGIVGQTMQFHGSANRYTLNGATVDRHALQQRTTATGSPAVTRCAVPAPARRRRSPTTWRRRSSTRGRAIRRGRRRSATVSRRSAPTTSSSARQPATSSRTGSTSTRSAIPQADEQQRLLANLIVAMNDSRKPLPRFWYFPNGKKAVVIMTGDDHGNGGTAGRFDQFKALEPGRLLGRELGVRARHVVRLSVDPADRCAGRRSTRPTVSRSACTSTPAAPTSRRRRCRPPTTSRCRSGWRSSRAAGAAAHAAPPLHRVERLEQRRPGAAVQGHAPGHLVLLLAAELGRRRARDVHRLGDADALHAAGRHASSTSTWRRRR